MLVKISNTTVINPEEIIAFHAFESDEEEFKDYKCKIYFRNLNALYSELSFEELYKILEDFIRLNN